MKEQIVNIKTWWKDESIKYEKLRWQVLPPDQVVCKDCDIQDQFTFEEALNVVDSSRVV